MSLAAEEWLSLLVAALFGFLLVLQTRFRNAPKHAQTAVLLGATILFFSICAAFLKPARIGGANPQATPTQWGASGR